MRSVIALLVTLPLVGCYCQKLARPSDKSAAHTEKPADSDHPSGDTDSKGESFGIANTFSGTLSEEQERIVPEALRGAFTIESLRPITATDLAKQLQFKTQVAEETRDGKRYVALKDFRCVQFSDEVSGQMIVIERYVVTPD